MNAMQDAELYARLSQVKLLALDVDGVMTDGGLYYTETGEELRKFNVKDGMGLKLLRQTGIEVAVITNSTCLATVHRLRKLGIQYSFCGVEDKLAILKELCEKLNFSPDQIAYVGDDVIDIPVLQTVGCPITVADAMPENLSSAIYVTKQKGGQGAVREVCDLLIQARQTMHLVHTGDAP